MRLSNSALTASRSSSSRARDGMVAVCVELLFYRAALCCAVLCSAVQPLQMPPSVHLRRACPDVLVRQQSQVQSWYRARAESSGSSLLVHSRGAGQHQNSKFKSERTGRTVPPAYSGNTKWDTNEIQYRTSKLSSPGTVTSPQQLQKRLNGYTVNVHGRTTRVHSHTGSLGHFGTQPCPLACLSLRPMRNRSIHIALS